MNTLILSITRNIIPYVKELRPIAGSVTACILMQQLDYWFSKKPQGFYKFLEPCTHPYYTKGDSWLEELGFSTEEFKNAYDKIGVRYKSKSDFINAPEQDKFKGNFYACYYDRLKRQMFYIRNHALLDSVLLQLTQSKKNHFSQTGKLSFLESDFPTFPETDKVGFSETKKLSFPETGKVGLQKPGKSVSIYNTDTTPDIPPSIPPQSIHLCHQEEEDFTQEAQDMVNLWDDIVRNNPGEKTFLRAERKKNLKVALEKYFGNTLQGWKAYCQKISTSRFLMGDTKEKFVVKLDWAIRPQSIEKILEGSITCGDREVSLETSSQKQTLTDTEISTYKKDFLQQMSTQNRRFHEEDIETIPFVKALFKSFLIDQESLRDTRSLDSKA